MQFGVEKSQFICYNENKNKNEEIRILECELPFTALVRDLDQ